MRCLALLALLALLVVPACHSVGGIAPIDSSDPDGDTDTDADADTDTDTDADADADTDADADADSDADTDLAGSYAGRVEAEGRWGRSSYHCSGDLWLEVAQGGSVMGTAICEIGGPYSVGGDVTGVANAESFAGIWAVETDWDAWDIPLEGRVDGEIFHANFSESLHDLSIQGEMNAERQR